MLAAGGVISRTRSLFVTAVLALLVTAAALAAAVAAMVGVAAVRLLPVLFLGAGGVVLAVGGALGGLLVARRHGLEPTSLVILVGVAVVLGVGASLALVPLDDPRRAPAAVEGMQTVELPTGDRIAYVRLPAGTPGTDGGAARTPIVFVHGGPGVADMRGDAEAFSRLVGDGHDLIVYDQVGTGHSERLGDPRDYTLQRDVDDLEALIAELHLDRPILIGHSYGGTVIAAYLARHPDGAEKVVFSAPGEIRPHAVSHGTGMVDRLDLEQKLALYGEMVEPRALLAWLLSRVDPRAALRFAGDAELDARFDRTYALSAPGLFCDAPPEIPLPTGLGFFANGVRRTTPDLRPALADVDVPALILKPQCDYLPWSYGSELRDAMPDARLVYLRGAGHSTYVEQTDAFFAEVRAFLADAPLPITPWTAHEPPPELTRQRPTQER
jgi:proline iminopeptidase